MSSAGHGRIVWHECLTKDPKKAMDFYTKLIGWTITTWDGKEPYHMFTNNGDTLAGVMKLPDEAVRGGAPSHWLLYVGVDDVDETHAQATKLGAKTMVKPTDIPEVGRFSVLADPQGALFAIFLPKGGPARPEADAKVGEFSWHELMTDDVKAALSFYGGLFSWEADQADSFDGGVYQMWRRKGAKRPIGGMFKRAPDMPPASWCEYIRVADIEKSIASVKSLGGQVMKGPLDVPGGSKIAVCADPVGAMFAMHWAPPG